MTPQEALDTLVSHARDFTDGTPAEAEVAAAADTLRAALAASGWTLAPVQTEDLPNGVPCRCVLLAGRCGCPCHADEAKVYYSEAEANAMLAAARSPHPAPDPLREALSAIEELPKWDKRSVPGGFHVNRADVLDILRAALAAPGLTLVPVQTEDLPNGVPCRCVLLAGRCGCPCHNDDVPAPDPLREAMTLTLALYTDLVEVLAMTVGETPEGRYECRMCESDVTSTPHSDDCEAERLRKWTYAAIPAAPARPVQDSNPLSRTPDPDPLRAHQYDHDGMARHHHDCDTGAAIWWSNAEQFGGVRVEHQKVAPDPLRDHEWCVPHDHVEPDQAKWERDQAASLAQPAPNPLREAALAWWREVTSRKCNPDGLDMDAVMMAANNMAQVLAAPARPDVEGEA